MSASEDREPGQEPGLGIAGGISRAFINSPLAPLLLIAALALGSVALMLLPREEEPQISVPMVDVFVEANGLAADDAVELVAKPLELLLQRLPGVEHVYSQTLDDRVMATARFDVGVPEDDAVLRVHTEIRANYDKLPVGIPEPLIVGRGINDVAILVLTLSPRADLPAEAAARWDRASLGEVASQLLAELAKTPEVGRTYLVGDSRSEIRIEPDPAALALYGVTLEQLVGKVASANRSALLGKVRQEGESLDILAGKSLVGVPDVGLLVVTTRDGRPVYVKDVARVISAPADADKRAWTMGPDALPRPAVSVALAKREGANAVDVAAGILARLEVARGELVPDALDVEITRNYGETAKHKSDELFSHLTGASLSIFAMIVVFIGWREGVVTLVIIPATILLTFAASYLMGYTINRVSLFALIFSIGILVDDAIVVVENIARHWRLDPEGDRTRVALRGVAEVGNPTIIATLTIVTALLPMLFVSGMMGPYMSPIPVNASAAMILSFFVAVIFAPWIMLRLQRVAPQRGGHDPEKPGRMARIYRAVASPILASRGRALGFLLIVFAATVASASLFATQDVTVKLLPFDDKSELQVVVDLPEGSTLEDTERALFALARTAGELPEVASIQAYGGTAAPFNFNGLVRHYYVRSNPEMGDLQLNLLPVEARERQSHEIALDLRERLGDVALPEGTAVRVVEAPPGPPVLATLLAEVYGPDAETRRAVAAKLEGIFRGIDFIVDVDDSFGTPPSRLRLEIDQANLDYHGVEQSAVHDTLALLFRGTTVGYSQRGGGVRPIPITVRLDESQRQVTEALLAVPVPARGPAGVGEGNVELGEVVTAEVVPGSWPVFRKNGHAIEMVTAELAGRFEAPIYGMIAVRDAIDAEDWGDLPKPVISLYGQPEDEREPILLWDGEWEVTYVTFRDMGAAFGAALLGIYLLIVGQFRSFTLPLAIMAPIPLTLIGIALGHWALGAPFTATSMIGFISLAGIIVRNSILLVDFIRRERAHGMPLHDALLAAGAVRFLPIFLTAITAMSGAAFILVDPIFQGLGISLLFGLASSTALTLLVIPAIYWVMRGGREGAR
ncbi:efflux RND transporter permease subunit [Albimonas sp. CAU 1670]|uniref:efflux RND transporter permease subunit n=1 Tax=Albimonas sp. CAU 1670 TaxID=3032599 RepID=UPI0023DA89C2|nr:efflux RND transporter permease subunit [Albimonas sp. CAU 1670]MDF2235450.1 efflux RND transporter permease subunit [Albimonas sp. CAU 1670]